MFMSLALPFACLGALAVAAIIASLIQYAPAVAELRRALWQLPPGKEIRLTLRPPIAQANIVLPRHRHVPKPIEHWLQGRAIA